MALDTTIGGPSADSYATLAEYTARAAAMGWTLGVTDAANEVNLRRAAVALDASHTFRGIKNTVAQAREWPRFDSAGYAGIAVFDPYLITPETIPPAIKEAQMELAFILQGGVDPLATVEAPIKREEKQVGSLRTETEYAGYKATPRVTAVERILRPYLAVGPGQARAVRG